MIFGKRLTPAERLRQHQRTLQKAQRELDRERTKLEAQVSGRSINANERRSRSLHLLLRFTGEEADDGYQEER